MLGPRRRASIEASATAEPEMPPIMKLRTIETWARPPAIQPVSSRANLTRRSVMPVAFIRLPARMKKGTARSGKFCVAVAIFCSATVGGIVPVRTKTGIAAIISAKATGRPATRKTTKRTPISESIRRRSSA